MHISFSSLFVCIQYVRSYAKFLKIPKFVTFEHWADFFSLMSAFKAHIKKKYSKYVDYKVLVNQQEKMLYRNIDETLSLNILQNADFAGCASCLDLGEISRIL